MKEIGRHINVSDNIEDMPKYVKKLGYNIFQFFLGEPQNVISSPIEKNKLIKLGERLINHDIKLVVHGSYTINLCHPIGSRKFKLSVKSLIQDLKSIEYIGDNCLGVIIHMGKNISLNNISYEEALENYVLGLKEALNKTNGKIILETASSQGSEIATNIEGLEKIYNKLNDVEKDRIFFCIDTCHIWSSGYDISTMNGVKKFFKEFKKIGINKIICIHFNNSKNKLHAKVDRHDDLNHGLIDVNGLKSFAKIAFKYNIPLIMETPINNISLEDELILVKSWI